MTNRPLSAEETLRLVARALAPYLVDELETLQSLRTESLADDYDRRTCERFVAELGDPVLARAATMFKLLQRDGVIDSLQLAATLGITPRELSGNLTTPIKRRARALRLPLPFSGGLGSEMYGGVTNPSADMDPERTHWQDRDGIARRMIDAIAAERAARTDTRSIHKLTQATEGTH